LIWNATASLPLGLYWRVRQPTTRHGDLVAFAVPQAVRGLVGERGYLPQGSLLVKPIAAAPGDRVCTRGGNLVVNGEAFGKVLTADREGRALPTDDTCGVLPAGQVYVASRTPGSFDSRTFGPVDVREVQARVVPLWTY
jgi:conjugative transfer signal peptidase TraF